jgi:hypothetical protein
MSKKIYLDAFYDQYEDLLQQMAAVFPTDPDWPAYRTGVTVLRRVSPMTLATKTWDYVSPYAEQIRTRNEAFFLTHTLAEGAIEQTIAKLRSMWTHLSVHNRTIVWEYVTNITYLAQKCGEIH